MRSHGNTLVGSPSTGTGEPADGIAKHSLAGGISSQEGGCKGGAKIDFWGLKGAEGVRGEWGVRGREREAKVRTRGDAGAVARAHSERARVGQVAPARPRPVEAPPAASATATRRFRTRAPRT
eukprot:6084573-Prymnesium_polylepis.1